MSHERAFPTPPHSGAESAPDRVSRQDLEQRLARARARTRDPRAGLFGPGSKLWEVNRELILFLGAGRAALLQLAHPFVAYAIQHHSHTRDDPFGRFQRTFRRVFSMVFGDLEAACTAAIAVHTIHERIRGRIPAAAGPFPSGSGYDANDPRALLWVHATLWDTSLQVYEMLVRPLGAAEKARYYAETRRFASLFGIPGAVVPRDWPAFEEYVQEMLASDTLSVTPPALEMARFLFRPPQAWLASFMERYRLITAYLLPPHLAAGFELSRRGAAGRQRHESSLAMLRRLHPHLPRRLRFLPAYLEAQRRIAGRTGRDRIGEQLNRLFVGSPDTR